MTLLPSSLASSYAAYAEPQLVLSSARAAQLPHISAAHLHLRSLGGVGALCDKLLRESERLRRSDEHRLAQVNLARAHLKREARRSVTEADSRAGLHNLHLLNQNRTSTGARSGRADGRGTDMRLRHNAVERRHAHEPRWQPTALATAAAAPLPAASRRLAALAARLVALALHNLGVRLAEYDCVRHCTASISKSGTRPTAHASRAWSRSSFLKKNG